MASKILSIEIGNSITRVCEMDFRVKNPKIYKNFCIPTPQGAIEDGFVRDSAEFVAAMRRALTVNKISTKQAVFSVTSSKIVTREVTLPALKINQVGPYIKANANDYFPIDLSMYELAHVVLGNETDDEGKEKLRVMVMAAGKDLISDYSRFASDCGLKFVCLDYSGNGIYQIMRNECGSETTLVIKVEDTATVATVISNGDMLLQRNLAYGIERACNALMESQEHYVGTYTEAFNTMTQKECIKVVLNDRTRVLESDTVFNETEAESDARAAITRTFSQLISNLARVIELHNSKAAGGSISQIILIGIGAEVQNLSKLFTNELGIPTRVLQNLSGAGFNALTAEDAALIGRYVAAVGAAIAPVDLVLTDKAKRTKSNVNYGLLSVLTVILGLLLISVMLLSAYLPYKEAKDKQEELQQKEQQYAEAEPVHLQHMAILELEKAVSNMCLQTTHANDTIVAFLEELEAKLPADVVLTEIVSNEESAELVMRAADYEQAAKVLQILRGFESVKDVNLGDAASKQDKEKNKKEGILFSAVCTYYPIVLDDSTSDATTN